MRLKSIVGFFLFCVIWVGTVLCETDPLVLQLLARVESLEDQGEQQKLRIKHLEEEVQELRLQIALKEIVDKDNNEVGGFDRTTDETEEIDMHGTDAIDGEMKTKQHKANKQHLPITNELKEPDESQENGDGISHDDASDNHGMESINGIRKAKPLEGIKQYRPKLTSRQQRRFVLDTENACFHATLDSGRYDHNHISQILVFDQVKLNLGGAYNNKTGIFVTPIQGLYIFSLSVRALGNATHIDIMKNGEEIGAAFADTVDQGSVTVAMQLDYGDTVHASIQRHEDVTIWGDKLTSFMGCLVMPLEF